MTQRHRVRNLKAAIRSMIAFAPKGVLRAILATFPLFAALVLQWVFWPVIQPFAWILFYPAVFVSSWIGGLSAGLWTTVLSTILVWWFFVPPEHSFARYFLAAGVFVGMGILFSVFHGRLRKATQQATESLAAARSANEALRESEANLNRAQEVAHIGSWYLDVTHNRLTWSDEVFRIFGVPKGPALTYEAFLGTVHPEDREAVDRALDRRPAWSAL